MSKETIIRREDSGYGLIPRHIMRNKELSLQAKAIYSYLISFAGSGNTAFPTIKLMLSELGIARATFYKYRDELVEKGALEITQERDSKGLFRKNIYYLKNRINPPCAKIHTPCAKSSASDKIDANNNKVFNSNNNTLKEKNIKKTKETKKPKNDTKQFEERFNEFWEQYPRKVSKTKAKEYFIKNKVSQELLEIILTGLEKYKKHEWYGKEQTFIPHPTTWLNQKRWLDDIQPDKIFKNKGSINDNKNNNISKPKGIVEL